MAKWKLPTLGDDIHDNVIIVLRHPIRGEEIHTTIQTLLESGTPICTETETEYEYVRTIWRN